MSVIVKSEIENYPTTPCEWCEFLNKTKVMVVPNFKTGKLQYIGIKKAEFSNERKFNGEFADVIITTTSDKRFGVIYCNGLMDLGILQTHVLQVDMNNPIENQRWVMPF